MLKGYSIKNILQKIKTFFSQNNRAQWCVFILFALTILAKCTLFHWNCFHTILISSLWKSPFEFFSFWCPKIAVSLFFASFIFVFKRPWWSFVFSFVFDLWILANIVYFRSNAAFLDVFALSMAGNMKGFWDSVWFYCSWKDSVYFVISIVYTIIAIFVSVITLRRSWIKLLIMAVLSYVVSLGGLFSMTRRWHDDTEKSMFFNPISLSMRTTLSSVSYTDHVKDFSILHSIGFIIVDEIENIKARQGISKDEIDEESLSAIIQNNNTNTSFSSPLILILVESLESWGVNEISTPNLWSFMQMHPCLYATKIKNQTKFGTSADGQMLLNTGLLPISQGAACFRFPTNKYPSIGECCEGRSVTILSHEIGVWNQYYMSPAYAYDTTIIRNENDSLLFRTTIDCLHDGYQMVQTITMSSHSPFNYGASRSSLVLPHSLPTYMEDYLKSLHYMDSGLSLLLSQIDNDTLLSKATIVITGDHTIFPKEMRAEYAKYCSEGNLPYKVAEEFVPLIIYSPKIKENVHITDTCYQMDIYPTIMHLVGCEKYYWKGFGIDLLDTTARNNRNIFEDNAYELSDKIIRSNYFAQYSSFKKANDQFYIAHAGGAINGYTYTNSLEAVQNAINKGIRYIELDLALTSDKRLVASHEWIGCEHWLQPDKLPPSHKDFMKHKVYDKFTPIDKKRIDSIMIANPGISLVTDRISTPGIIDSSFSRYKERVWVECFSDEDYFELEKLGYHVLRSKFPPSKSAAIIQAIKHFTTRELKIDCFTFGGNTSVDLQKRKGKCFAIYTSPNKVTADSLFAKDTRIKFVYIDDIDTL